MKHDSTFRLCESKKIREKILFFFSCCFETKNLVGVFSATWKFLSHIKNLIILLACYVISSFSTLFLELGCLFTLAKDDKLCFMVFEKSKFMCETSTFFTTRKNNRKWTQNENLWHTLKYIKHFFRLLKIRELKFGGKGAETRETQNLRNSKEDEK